MCESNVSGTKVHVKHVECEADGCVTNGGEKQMCAGMRSGRGTVGTLAAKKS